MMKRILTGFLLAVALCGCQDQTGGKPGTSSVSQAVPEPANSPGGEVRRTIERYNRLLSDGYRNVNMTSLQEVATKELAEKAYYHMAAIGEGNTRMQSELTRLEVVSTEVVTPEKCRVATRERWDFSYVEIKTAKKLYEVKDYLYDVTYLLEKRAGRWLITDISATGEDRKEVPTWKELLKKR